MLTLRDHAQRFGADVIAGARTITMRTLDPFAGELDDEDDQVRAVEAERDDEATEDRSSLAERMPTMTTENVKAETVFGFDDRVVARYGKAQILEWTTDHPRSPNARGIYDRGNGDLTAPLPLKRHMQYASKQWTCVAITDAPTAAPQA